MDDELQRLAKMVLSGEDQWINFTIDSHTVRTTTIFVKKYQDHLDTWVREFVEQQAKVHPFGTHVLIDAADRWEKEFEGELIYQLRIHSPEGEPIIVIETFNRLLELRVLKACVPDGQNRTKLC